MALRPAAFFDFDRTVVQGDAGVSFGRELMRLARRHVREDRPGTLGWLGRNVAHEARTAKLLGLVLVATAGTAVGLVKRSRIIRTGYRQLKGIERADLAALASDYFEDVLSTRVFPEAREEMERHRAEGRSVVVASTGMHEVVDPVKRHLPVDDVVAVTLRDEGGRLTGAVDGPLWGAEKAAAVRDYAHAHDLSLPRSWAYTDHHSDLAFLQLVGHPVAVNPTFRLARLARRKKWAMRRWTLPTARVA